MLRWVFVLILLTSMKAFSAEVPPQVFHYHKGPLELSDELFRRYGLPQLRSMANEYFYLIRQLTPDAAELISLREQLNRFKNDTDRWWNDCHLKRKPCLPQMQELLRQARNLDQITLRHLSNRLNYSQAATNQDTIESIIWLESTLGQISMLNYQFSHALEQRLMLVQTPYQTRAVAKMEIHQLAHEMLLLSEIAFTALLPPGLRDDFHSLWVEVIKPIEQKIILPQDKEFFLARMEGLNTSWNSFQMRMTRGTSELPKAQQNLTRIMHNRWNSIQRLILR